MTNELQILIETLEKKKGILNQILDRSTRQGEIAKAEPFEVEQFDVLFDEKTELLAQMEQLDQGFDSVFQKIRDELLMERTQYKTEISQMQQLIQETIDLGASIHATEARTKESMSVALQRNREELIQRKTSSKSVVDYYKANNQLNYLEPYFIDQKK